MSDHKSKTVVIVGAGASREFNLPVGNDLMELISKELSMFDKGTIQGLNSSQMNNLFSQVVAQGKFTWEQLLDASRKIVAGLPYAHSIDNFLHSNTKNEAIIVVGKLAISTIIVAQERISTLYKGPDEFTVTYLQDVVKVNDSWLHRFFKILTSNKTFTEFIESLSNITFVSFNYDRCIQQFFWNSVSSYFSTIEDAMEIAQDALNIEYIYGSVGEFDYSKKYTSFGSNDDLQTFLKAPETIRTFTEGEQEGVRKKIRGKIHEADNLLILGFGFIPINMDLLFAQERFGTKAVLSTAFGISDPDRKVLEKKIIQAFFWKKGVGNAMHQNPLKGLVRLNNISASDLFHEYSQYLMMANKKGTQNLLRT